MRAILLGTLLAFANTGPAAARHPPSDPTEPAGRPDLSRAASSDPQRKAQAQKLVGEGRAAFDQHSFGEAAARFEAAYRLFPLPKMFYNLGITYQALGRTDRALCALERFVHDAPDADPKLIAESRRSVDAMQKEVARVDVEAPAGAVLLVDGDERAVAPGKAPLCVEPGHRRVAARVTGAAEAGGEVGIDLAVTSAASYKVALDPASKTARLVSGPPEERARYAVNAPPPPAVADEQPLWKKWWVWTAAGVVVTGAVATGIALALRPVDVAAPPANYGPYKVFP